MIKVLNITNVFRSDGGTEIAAENLVRSLDFSKFEIWMGSLYPYGKFRNSLPILDDHIICFNYSTGVFATLQAIKQACQFMHCNQFDIVHTHQFEAGLIFRIAAWITGVPVTVFTYHSTHFPRQRTGHYMIDRALALRTTQLIAVSEAAKISVSQQLRLSLGQFLVIPNFVHLKEITILSTNEKQTKRLHLDLKTDQFVIISIGRLEVPKGFSILLEAIRIVKEKFHDLILLLVGEGSLRTQLQQLAVELKIQNEVRFLGVRKDVYVLLQLSDIFVMSSWWEGMPIALLEAGACGLPAIASAVGGITEIVSEGVNGLLVPPQDSEALALRIIDLLTKPDLRHRMGIRARKIIEEKFSSDVVGYQLGGLYERLLTQRLNQ